MGMKREPGAWGYNWIKLFLKVKVKFSPLQALEALSVVRG
jgi:hypothetical protein